MAKRKKTQDSGPRDPKAGDNSGEMSPEERRTLFLKHRTTYEAAQKKIERAKAERKKLVGVIKADGFTVAQVETALRLQTPKGEKAARKEIADALQAALWVGCDLAGQMDLFKTAAFNDATDRAYDEGQQASMENKPAKPPYDPDTPNYRNWLEGYHDHQEELAGKIGRGNLDKDGGDKITRDNVTSGQPVSRKEFKEQLAESTRTDGQGGPAKH